MFIGFRDVDFGDSFQLNQHANKKKKMNYNNKNIDSAKLYYQMQHKIQYTF